MSSLPSYRSPAAIGEAFRAYLEQSGVVDALTRALVSLYESPVRPAPDDALAALASSLAGEGASSVAAALRAENARLREENAALRAQLERAPAAAGR